MIFVIINTTHELTISKEKYIYGQPFNDLVNVQIKGVGTTQTFNQVIWY